MFDIFDKFLWNAPDTARGPSGGAATDTGAAPDTAAPAGTDGDATTVVSGSVLTGKPSGDKPGEAAGGDEKAADQGDEPETDPADAVPEDGKYTYDLPEGVTANTEIAESMNPVFKEAGLTQKQVSTVVSAYAELVQKDQVARAEQVDTTLTGWLEAARSDKDIGGDKWDDTIQKANSVLAKFGDDEIDTALEITGAGVHPAVIRLLSRIGGALSDDTFVAGSQVAGERDPSDHYAKTTPAGKRG